jgi:hypothetical protein
VRKKIPQTKEIIVNQMGSKKVLSTVIGQLAELKVFNPHHSNGKKVIRVENIHLEPPSREPKKR